MASGATGSSDPHNSNESPTRDLGDEHQFKKRKRACMSKVWIDMIKIDNGTRAQGVSDEDQGTSSSFPILATEWEIEDKIMTISVDNASANDAAMKIYDARLKVFSQVAQQLHLPDRKLILDCKTRWNSTYKMLSTAITFKEAFSMYEVREPLYKHCPSDDDWEKIESIYKTLEAFDACTNIVSGSDYQTSNLYFGEVQYIKQVLDRQFNDEHLRCKFTMFELYFKDLYDANEILKKNLELKKILREIHAEYARLFRVRPASSTSDSNSSIHEGETEQVGPSRWFSYYYSRLKQTDVFDLESLDLDVYLIEGIYLCKDNSAVSFNILDWWKSHETKFPILSKMAAHFLAISITTVASEATLSASGRVIDTYRASLDLKTVQALICGGDWIRKLHGVKKKNKQQQDDGIVSRLKFVRIGEDYQEYGLEILDDSPQEEHRQRFIRSSRVVTIQDTPSAPKPKPSTSKPKLKGTQSLTSAKKEVADIMQALKESKKSSKRQPGTGGSSEGTGTTSGVPDESIVVFATSSEGTGTKPGVPNEEKDISEEKVILEWGSKQESEYLEEDQLDEEKHDKEGDVDDEGDDHISDTQDTDDEDDETESESDDIYKYKIRVRKDEDVEMTNAEVEETKKGNKEDTDVAKADTEKTEEAKDDSKKAKLPPTSSSLSISSGFGDQFLKLSSDTSLVGTVKDTTNVEISSLLDIKIQSEVPHIQSSSVLRVLVSVISEPTVLTLVQETSSAAPITTLPLPSVSPIPHAPQHTTTPIPTPPITTDAPTITTANPESDALSVVQLRVAKLEKDMFRLKNVDHSAATIATLNKIKTPTVNLKKGSEKSASEILKIKREQAEMQKTRKFTIKSIDKAALKEFDQKSALYQTMHANKSFNRNLANHRLYHALIEALIEDENPMDKGVADTVKDHKRKHDDDEDDDEDPLVGLNQGKKTKRRRTNESESSKKPSTTKETPKGKAPSKGSKTGKAAFSKEPVEEPTAEVV
ncbi:ribonuclease H-like domain-containing protein, partial [Tanacetum coccineum]